VSRPAHVVIKLADPRSPDELARALKDLKKTLAKRGVLTLMRHNSRLYMAVSPSQKKREKHARAMRLVRRRAWRRALRENEENDRHAYHRAVSAAAHRGGSRASEGYSTRAASSAEAAPHSQASEVIAVAV
jgi:ribosomal protein S21